MKVEKSIYDGYLWFSDQQAPKILQNEEFELDIADNTNPFVIEGQLYDHSKMVSTSIKYIDGKYIVLTKKVESSDFNRNDVEIKEFLPNRMSEISKLRFLQYWKATKDELCEGMEVLQPAELVFVGFKNKEE